MVAVPDGTVEHQVINQHSPRRRRIRRQRDRASVHLHRALARVRVAPPATRIEPAV